MSSIRYHLSQTLFVPSPRWCQLICEKSNVPYCQRKSTLSSDAAAQPRFVPLTAEVINRSRQNPPSFHQDRNTPSCLAPSGLTNGLKFSLNGLPGDAAAELQRGASSSVCLSLSQLGSLTVAHCKDTGIYAHKSCISCTLGYSVHTRHRLGTLT